MHPKALGVGYCPLVKAVVLSPGFKSTSPGGLKQSPVSWPHNTVVTLESEGKAWEKGSFSFSFLKKIIYFWLCWVFIAGWGCFSSCSEQGLVSRCGAQASHSSGFSRFGVWALAHMGLVVVAYGLACPAACGNFLPLGSNPCFTGRSDS